MNSTCIAAALPLAVMFTGMLPVQSGYIRELVVIREGFYFYIFAALGILASGLVHLRQC